ncbi:MAG: GNAT family N-acetyltransferase [SAR324 cluster bacterium]|nr:GNAT family N-acetyltransferase [SAR324 cluster bacterium]
MPQNTSEHISRLSRNDLSSDLYQNLVKSLFNISTEKATRRLQYLEWILDKNPALPLTEDLPIYIYWVGSNPVGQLIIIPVELIIEGQPIKGGWAVDFYLLKEYQRGGIGKKLLDAVYQDFPLLMAVANSKASFGLFEKLRWNQNAPMTCYTKMLNPEYSIPKKGLHLFNRVIQKLGLNVQIKLDYLKPATQNSVLPDKSLFEPVNSFENIDLSSSFKSISDKNTAYIPRSKAFLQWRYFSNPFAKYNAHHIRTNKDNEAYIIWRMIDDPLWCRAVVVDILSAHEISTSHLQTMLDLFIKYASSQGAERFECITNNSKVLDALPQGILAESSIVSWFLYGMMDMKQCPTIESWEIFAGDCDVDAVKTHKE